ncbi:MAG: DUF2970 domain-containing protein [Rhodobacter sp.]|nr:DUF2970 domain-containing protein [Rhodobacter sp.]
MDQPENEPRDERRELSFMDTFKSTAMAFLGVQSNANRERDFSQGKMSHFIWMGLILGAAFVLTLVGVVQLVLHFAGS